MRQFQDDFYIIVVTPRSLVFLHVLDRALRRAAVRHRS
jgi:hypothetical protein